MTEAFLPLLKLGYGVLRDAYKYISPYVIPPKTDDEGELARHIVFVETWSRTVGLLGMVTERSVDDAAIAVRISQQPRRFFATRHPEQELTEREIAQSTTSTVILGDPGSGKTTIVRRMIRQIIIEEAQDNDIIQFPILVLGRDLNSDDGLFGDIFKKIGFKVSQRDVKDKPTLDDENRSTGRKHQIQKAVLAALMNAEVAIFIDGLDEIEPQIRRNIENEIELLNNTISKGKIIITCRSGDWIRSIQNFRICAICPLSDKEIEMIISRWANNPENFKSSMSVVPYKDILNRPLFLTMLIMIFNQSGSLPDRPYEIYHRVVYLMIEKWDSQRGVERKSRYTGFLLERKFRFLCALAYSLTKDVQKSRFSSEELLRAFAYIHRPFGFERSEGREVIQEIESHTGIIVEAGFDQFEFSHLTIQEFLAATHLSALKGVSPATLVETSTATVAVAISLSADPSTYLAAVIIELILEDVAGDLGAAAPLRRILIPLLHRLKQEGFAPSLSVVWGFAAVILVLLASRTDLEDEGRSRLASHIDFAIQNETTHASARLFRFFVVPEEKKDGTVTLHIEKSKRTRGAIYTLLGYSIEISGDEYRILQSRNLLFEPTYHGTQAREFRR